jgi:hypothetical protein
MASLTDVMNGDEELPAGARLKMLAVSLLRLAPPSPRDPERFHLDRDRIAVELREVARAVDCRPRPRSPSNVAAKINTLSTSVPIGIASW